MPNHTELLAPVVKRLAALETDQGFATNGQHKIHYRTFGSGPAIVFTHGFPDIGGFTYASQIEELARDHLVVTPTMRGFPPSSVSSDPADYVIPILQEDFTALFDHLGIEKAHVAGHDWGGVISQAFALSHPERVNSLIIMNSPVIAPFTSLVNHDVEQQKLSKYTIGFINYEEGGPAPDFTAVTEGIREPEWRSTIGAYLEDSPLIGMMNYYKMGFPRPPYGAPDPEDVSGFICQVPTLIVWGLEDEYFSLKVINDLWRWFAPSYRLVAVPGAGHWVYRDQPQKVNAELRSWLRDQS